WIRVTAIADFARRMLLGTWSRPKQAPRRAPETEVSKSLIDVDAPIHDVASPLARADSHRPGEHPDEMALIRKTRGQRDRSQCLLAVAHERGGHVDASSHQPSVRCDAHRQAECAGKVTGGNAALSGHLL